MACDIFKACFQWLGACWDGFLQKLPLGARRWPTALRWVSLVIGCFGMAAGGTTTTFSFWQNAMRAILNQTETQSNLVITVGNVGSLIAFPSGMIYERYGCQADVIIGGVIACAAFLVLWLGTSVWKEVFAANSWLVVLVYFFVGFGCIATYMGSLMPNTENFPYHQRGKIIGVLDGALSVGPTLLSVLYNTAFTNGYITEGQESNQNLPGFFLTLFFLYLAITISLLLLNGRIEAVPDVVLSRPSSISSVESAPILENGDNGRRSIYESISLTASGQANNNNQAIGDRIKIEDTPPNDFSEFPFADLPITKALFRWDFWFLMLQFVLSSCSQVVFQTNISTYLRSFDLAEYNLLFTVLNTTLQAVSKFIAGIVSDMIAEDGRMPRAVLYLVPYSLQTFFLLLCAFYGDNFIVLLLTSIFVGVAFGVTWCQTPTLIGELYGSKYLGSNWGWAMLTTALSGFIFSLSFSSIYEAAITVPGDIYCYGLQCFTWSFIFLAGTSLCSVICSWALTENMLRNAKDRRHYYGKRNNSNENK